MLRITQSGVYSLLKHQGDGSPTDDGVEINAPGALIFIKHFDVSRVRVPLVVRDVGHLFIERYEPHHFWGDTLNLRCSRVTILSFKPRFIEKRFPYAEYHQDVIFQAYATLADGYTLDPKGVISHIYIHSIDVESTLPDLGGVVLSERNRYSDIHLGAQRLHVGLPGPWWFNANTVSNCTLGGLDNKIYSTQPGGSQPGVKIDNPKNASWASSGNSFVGSLGPVVGAGRVIKV